MVDESLSPSELLLAQIIRSVLFAGAVPVPAFQDIDARELVIQAHTHRVAPLLYVALKQLQLFDQLPNAAGHVLQRSFMQNMRRNGWKYGELYKVLDQLEASATPVVLLKGAAVAATIYPNQHYRAIGDLDFLIHKQDLPRVAEILTGMGYSAQREVAAGFRQENLGEEIFIRQDPMPCSMEPHWHLFSLPYYTRLVPIDWFWQHTEPVEIGHRQALIFAPTAQLLHLTAHYYLHHGGNHLRWTCDMALLLARHGPTIDWPTLVEAATRFEVLQSLKSSLAQVAAVWGVEAPPAAEALLSRARPGLKEQVNFAIVAVRTMDARNLWDAATAPGVRGKLRYLRQLFFPSAEYMRRRYGMRDQRLLPFYYLRRWGNGLVKFPPSAWAMMRNALRMRRGPGAMP
ncbi:MAG: nucleotidyltransferase family protein [Caldilineaceae bacterium]|nr:nucleotidyltransferase family protein [Caldilineaceae bacterium]